MPLLESGQSNKTERTKNWRWNALSIFPSLSSHSIHIGARIFFLIGFLMVLFAMTSGLSIWQMSRISTEIEEIYECNIPLMRILTEITVHQLEQEINLDSGFRAAIMMKENAGASETFEKAVQKFSELTGKIEEEFLDLKGIVGHALVATASDENRQEHQSMLAMLDVLDKEHTDYNRQSLMAFKHIAAGNIDLALTLLPRIEAEEQDLYFQLEKMLAGVEEAFARSIKMVEAHEHYTIKLLLAITGVTLIFGIVTSVYIVRQNILHPLKDITKGLEALGADDMSVEVKIHHKDEIGRIATAYADFRETLIKLKRREQELKTEHGRVSKLNMRLTSALEARKKAQSALSISWRRFVDIAEMSPDWIWESDGEHRFKFASDQFVTATGKSRRNILDRGWVDIGVKSGSMELRDKLATRRPFHNVEISLPANKNKTARWLISGRPVFGDEGAFMGYRGVGIDMKQSQSDGKDVRDYSESLEEFINLAVIDDENLDAPNTENNLTPREKEILGWVKQGKSYADIAEILSISRRTIEFHIGNVMNKLGASNRVSAVVIAMRRGILRS